ncbi:MAG: GTP pyrophosphokinase [Prochlorotrichaceae cyanobacterium]
MADLQRAIEIAVSAHQGQRQRNGLPYVLHPFTLMLEMKSIPTQIAAVLHDVVEDSEWTLAQLAEEGFAPEILTAIDCLTHREGEPYTAYIDRIAENSLARQVKLADLRDNMDIQRIPHLNDRDLERLGRYHQAWLKLQACHTAT